MILHNVYLRQDGYVFGRVCLFVGLSVHLSDHLKGNKRDLNYLFTRGVNNSFEDDPEYDTDPRSVLRSEAHGFE